MQQTYVLKRLLWAPPLIATVFGAMGALFVVRAMDGVKGIYFLNLFLLPSEASRALYALFALVCFGFVALSGLLFFMLAQGRRIVTVTRESITVPQFSFKGLKRREIHFSRIRKLELFQAGNGMFLNIHHSEGRATLAKLAFRSEQEFNALCNSLAQRTKR